MIGWVILALLALSLLGDGDPVAGVADLLNGITRGARLTHAVYGSNGVVDADPEKLARQAGTGIEPYALARMISSEEGNADPTTKAAIALVAVNYANRGGKSIGELLLHAKNPAHSGFFGTQRDIDAGSTNYDGSDRYASTALDPYAGDLEIAVGVLNGSIPDFTGGAIQFDNVSAFKTEAAAARTAANRLAEGRTQVYPAGVDEKLRFWA